MALTATYQSMELPVFNVSASRIYSLKQNLELGIQTSLAVLLMNKDLMRSQSLPDPCRINQQHKLLSNGLT